MDDRIKRCIAKRKAALIIEMIQGKATAAEASRSLDFPTYKIEGAKRGMESSSRTNPLGIREQYEMQLEDLRGAYGDAMLELAARKKFQALIEREDEKIQVLDLNTFIV